MIDNDKDKLGTLQFRKIEDIYRKQQPEQAVDSQPEADDFDQELEEFYAKLEKEAPDLLPDDRKPKGIKNFGLSMAATEKQLRSGAVKTGAEAVKDVSGQAQDEQFVTNYPTQESQRVKDVEMYKDKPELGSKLTQQIAERMSSSPVNDPKAFDSRIEELENKTFEHINYLNNPFNLTNQPERVKVNQERESSIAELQQLRHKKKLIEQYGDLDTAYNELSARLRGENSIADQMLTKADEIKASAPYYNPNTFSGFAGSAMVSVVPSLVAVAASPFTSGTSLAFLPAALSVANISYLTSASAGMGMQEYESYVQEKGLPIDRDTMWQIGVMHGAFEAVAESLRLPRWLPKGMFVSKMVKEAIERGGIKGVEQMLQEYEKKAGKSFFKAYSKEMLKQGWEEGAEEMFTEAGQMLSNTLYKDSEDFASAGEIATRMLQSGAGGFFAGAFLGAARVPTISYTQRKARERSGFVTLAEVTGDNLKFPVVEVLGMSGDNAVVMTPTGKQEIVPKSSLGQIVPIELQDFKNYETNFQKDKGKAAQIAQEIEQKQTDKDKARRNKGLAEMLRHEDGKGYIVFEEAGNPETTYNILSGEYKLDEKGDPILGDQTVYTVIDRKTGKKSIKPGSQLNRGMFADMTVEQFMTLIDETEKAQDPSKQVENSPELKQMQDKINTGLKKESPDEIIEVLDVTNIEDGFVIISRTNPSTFESTSEQMTNDEVLDLFAEEIAAQQLYIQEKRQKEIAIAQGKKIDVAQQGAQTEGGKAAELEAASGAPDATLAPETVAAQQAKQELPRSKDGEIDYDAIKEPQMYSEALQQDFGDEAVQTLDNIIAAKEKAVNKIKDISDIKTAKKKKKMQEEIKFLQEVKQSLTPQTNENEQDVQGLQEGQLLQGQQTQQPQAQSDEAQQGTEAEVPQLGEQPGGVIEQEETQIPVYKEGELTDSQPKKPETAADLVFNEGKEIEPQQQLTEDVQEVEEKIDELQFSEKATDKLLKEQKQDIVSQLDDVIETMWNNAPADERKVVLEAGLFPVIPLSEIVSLLKAKGYNVSEGGMIKFSIYKDGNIQFNVTNALYIRDQINKDFPTTIDSKNKTKSTGGSSTRNSKNVLIQTAVNRGSLEATQAELQQAKDNQSEAERVGNKKLADVFKEEVERETKILAFAERIDFERAKLEQEYQANEEVKKWNNTDDVPLPVETYKKAKELNLLGKNYSRDEIEILANSKGKSLDKIEKETKTELDKLEKEKVEKFGRVDGKGFVKPKNNAQEAELRNIDTAIGKRKSELKVVNELKRKQEKSTQPTASDLVFGEDKKGKDRKTIVLDEGNGIIINDLWNEYNAITNQEEQDVWNNKVKNTKFGTYGTVSLFETLNKFEPKYPNDVLKKDFITALEQALDVPQSQRTYKNTSQPDQVPDVGKKVAPDVQLTEQKTGQELSTPDKSENDKTDDVKTETDNLSTYTTIPDLQEALADGKVQFNADYQKRMQELRQQEKQPKTAGEMVFGDSEDLSQAAVIYGWTTKTNNDKTELINRKGDVAAIVTTKGSKYTITDVSGNKLLTGNNGVNNGVKKVIKEYFYGQEISDDTPRFSLAPTSAKVDDIGFYSTIENALGKITQEKGTPEQFKAMLLKNGAKQAEMDWMGWSDRFPDNKKTITKADIQQWIDGNRIEVKEVVLGKKRSRRDLKMVQIEPFVWNVIDDNGKIYLEGVSQDSVAQFIDGEWEGDNTKFSQYQTPGGENYKELLLVMPAKSKVVKNGDNERLEILRAKRYELLQRGESIRDVDSQIQLLSHRIDDSVDFRSSHFNEPNILAHVRFNERTVNGERVLFLEEVQSDWAASNRKELDKLAEPDRIRKQIDNIFGSELSSVMPFELMDTGVISVLHHDQVRKDIISRIPVDVMNDLNSFNLSTNDILSNSSVNLSPIPFETRRRIGLSLLSALRDTGALLRTKLLEGGSTGGDKNLLPTLKASDLSSSEIVSVLSPDSIYHDSIFLSTSSGNVTTSGTIKPSALSGVTGGSSELNPTMEASSDNSRKGTLSGTKSGSFGLAGLNEKLSTASLAKFLNWHNNLIKSSNVKSTLYKGSPFVDNTKDYVNISLRRMMRYAAENGFDRIAWTTGDMQAERYDLSKQVDYISYKPNENGTYDFIASRNSSEIYNKKGIDITEVEATFGKDIAEKTQNKVGKKAGTVWHGLEGDNLKIGGSGMRSFYDAIIPAQANKLGKPFGAKVESIDTGVPKFKIRQKNNGFYEVSDVDGNMVMNNVDPSKIDQWKQSGIIVQSLPVTEQMKQSVMQGQPLFQIIGEKGAANLDAAQEATTRLDNLNVAREMEAAGKDPKTIRLATGWEKGVDGLWRYEVEDGKVNDKHYSDLIQRKFNEDIKQGLINATSLGELYQSASLYEAYPELENVHVVFFEDENSKALASFNKAENAIYIYNPLSLQAIEGRNSNLIHEIQHVIQDREGFAKGGNLKQFEASQSLFAELKERLELILQVDELAKKNNTTPKYIVENAGYREWEVEYLSNYTDSETNWKYVVDIAKDKILTPEQKYKRLAGEVEARNAQTREVFTPQQRRETLLAETEDVAREDQIILQQSIETSQSVSDPLTSREAKIAAIERLNSRSKSPVRTVILERQDQLPAQVLEQLNKGDIVKGMFYGGTVYYILENVVDATDAANLWIHEHGIHVGVTRLIPDRAARLAFFEKVVDDIGVDQIKKVVNGSVFNLPKHVIGEEYIAYLVNKKISEQDLTEAESGVWQKFIDFVNRWLTKLMDANVRITEADIIRIAKAAIQKNWEDVTFSGGDAYTQRYISGKAVDAASNAKRTAADMVFEDTKQMYEQGMRFMTGLYHGSPHAFDRFSTQFMGAGEGAQAYGWGLYFTDKEGIAKSYARSKGKYVRDLIFNDKPFMDVVPLDGNKYWDRYWANWIGVTRSKEDFINTVKMQYLDGRVSSPRSKRAKEFEQQKQRLIDAANNGEITGWPTNERNLYKVKIHGDKTINDLNFLRWDKEPTTEQLKTIKQIWDDFSNIADYKEASVLSRKFDMGEFNGLTGAEIYDKLMLEIGGFRSKLEIKYGNDVWGSSDKIASLILLENGIDGIQYPSEYLSKGTHDDSFNYVVFDENSIEIDEHIRFSLATTPPLSENPAPASKQQQMQPVPIFDTHLPLHERFKKNRPAYYQELITDKHIRWAHLNNDILNMGGFVPEWANVYLHATTVPSKNQAEMQNFDKEEWNTLLDVLTEIQKEKYVDLANIQKYMMAKHAPERNAELRRKNPKAAPDTVYAGSIDGELLTDEHAEKLIKMYEKTIGQDLVDKLWKASNAVNSLSLKLYFDGGFINQETYDNLSNMYSHYVPLRGWKGDTMNDVFDYITQDIDNPFQTPVKKAEGRTSEADDPLPYMEAMAYTAIMAKNKNQLKQKPLHLARLNQKIKGFDDIMKLRRIFLVDAGKDQATGEIVWKEAIVENGRVLAIEQWNDSKQDYDYIDMGALEDLKGTGKLKMEYNSTHFRRNTASQASQHEFTVFEKGVKYIMVMKADPNLALVLNNKTDKTLQVVNSKTGQDMLDLTTRATRQLSTWLTSKNPAFIPVNFIRDISYATIAHGLKSDSSAKIFLDKAMNQAPQAIHRYMRGESDPNNPIDQLYERYRKNGGQTGFAFLNDLEVHRKKITKDLKRLAGTNSLMDKLGQSKVPKVYGNTIEYLAVMSEDISRFATFLTSKELGKSDIQAVNDAKNITVNFNQKGRIAPLLGMGYAFANAAIQGGVNISTLAYKNKETFGKAAAGFVVLGFMIAELMRMALPDEDDYLQINEYLRDNYMILPNPAWLFGKSKDKYISIPLPHGFRFFYSIGQATSDVVHGHTDPGAFGYGTRVIENLADSFSPWNFNLRAATDRDFGLKTYRPMIPTWGVPVYDLIVNEDFAQRRVYKEMFTPVLEENTPASEKGLSNTNKTLTAITKGLNKLGGGDENIPAGVYFDPKTGEEKKNVLKNWMLDVNPAKLEHLIEGYTGGVGTFFNQSYKTLHNAVLLATDKNNDVEFETRDVPVLSRLYRQIYRGNEVEKYYDLQRRSSDFKHYSKIYKKSDDERYTELMNNESLVREMRFAENLKKQVKNRFDDKMKENEDDIKLIRELRTQKDAFILEQMNMFYDQINKEE